MLLLRLPDELVVTVLSFLGAEELARVACTHRAARELVIDAIHAVTHVLGVADEIDDYTLHGLFGVEMRDALRAILGQGLDRVRALSECTEFQLYMPTLAQALADRGSVVWLDGGDVRLEPTHAVGDIMRDVYHSDDLRDLYVDEDELCALAGADMRRFLDATDVRAIRECGTRRYVKRLHVPTTVLHPCTVHARAARLLRTLAHGREAA